MPLEGIYDPNPHEQELLEKEKDPRNFDRLLFRST
jgi:hypothetical protein